MVKLRHLGLEMSQLVQHAINRSNGLERNQLVQHAISMSNGLEMRQFGIQW